jgi:hypothetical protein
MRFTLNGDTIFSALLALQEINQQAMPMRASLKLAQIARALRGEALDIQAKRDAIRQQYAVRFPADHPTHAGKIVPIYLDGTAPEKQTPENAAAIIPNAMRFTDDEAVRSALVELGEVELQIECPAITSADLEGGTASPAQLEALLWLIDAQELPPDAKPERRRRRVARGQ